MRYALWVLVCFAFMSVVTAQEIACTDGQTLYNGFTLKYPMAQNVPDQAPEILTFSVVGVGDVEPIINIGQVGDQAVCVPMNPALVAIGADLGTTTVTPSLNTVVASALDLQQTQITMGNTRENGGQLLVVVEGNSMSETADDYTLNLSETARESGQPVLLYAISTDPTQSVTLSLLDAENNPLACDDPTRCSVEGAGLVGKTVTTLLSQYTFTAQDAFIQVDADQFTENAVNFRVVGGTYTLVMFLANAPFTTTNTIPVASVRQADDLSYELTCDGVSVWTNGIPLAFPTMPDDAVYTVTAVGVANYDPVLAVVDAEGNGVCADNTPEAQPYATNLPGWTVPSQNTSAQLTVKNGERVFLGAKENLGSDVFVLIEGMSFATSEVHTVDIETTVGMVNASSYLVAYMVAETGDLDPLLTWRADDGSVVADIEGLSVQCDNAGIPETCYSETDLLRGYGLTLANNRQLPLDSVDAQLRVPIYADMGGQTLHIEMGKASLTGTSFVLVLHPVTN